MKNIYIVKIDNKTFNRLIKYIYILKIKKYKDNYILYLDYNNYKKIIKYKYIYKIEIIDYKGFIKYKMLFKKYYLFLIIFFISILYIIYLSNIIFSIQVNTNDKELESLIINELSNNNISLYKRKVSFLEKEKIKNKILENNKDKIEWLEITNIGSKYIINVEERIINNIEINNKPRNIVALKNAIILKLEISDGLILKSVNDYVKAGDVIVSGEITHNGEVVDLISANGSVFGETWYNVHVSYPIAYYSKDYTGNIKKGFSITFLSKKINLFNFNYLDYEIIENNIVSHKFLPFNISFDTIKEVLIIDDVYTVDEVVENSLKEARLKIEDTLDENEMILSEKKLKIIINDSTIDIDIFFKVYENITSYQEIIIEGE